MGTYEPRHAGSHEVDHAARTVANTIGALTDTRSTDTLVNLSTAHREMWTATGESVHELMADALYAVASRRSQPV